MRNCATGFLLTLGLVSSSLAGEQFSSSFEQDLGGWKCGPGVVRVDTKAKGGKHSVQLQGSDPSVCMVRRITPSLGELTLQMMPSKAESFEIELEGAGGSSIVLRRTAKADGRWAVVERKSGKEETRKHVTLKQDEWNSLRFDFRDGAWAVRVNKDRPVFRYTMDFSTGIKRIRIGCVGKGTNTVFVDDVEWRSGLSSAYIKALEYFLSNQEQIRDAGAVLFKEDFEKGLGQWKSVGDRCKVVDRPDGRGKCVQIGPSGESYLTSKEIPINWRHPVAVYWKTRYVVRGRSLNVQVHHVDENGKGTTTTQVKSSEHVNWTDDAVLVSVPSPGDYRAFKPGTRGIKVTFAVPAMHSGQPNPSVTLVDEVRVLDLGAAVEKLLRGELARCMELAQELPRAASALPATPLNDAWKKAIETNVPWMRQQLRKASRLALSDPRRERVMDRAATYSRRLMDAVKGLGDRTVISEKVLVYRTPATSPYRVLPRRVDREPNSRRFAWAVASIKAHPQTRDLPGGLTSQVTVTACRGEYEPVSLVLWAPYDVPSVLPVISDLRGADGHVIPAANIDIKWVLCWYQAGSAWLGNLPHRYHPFEKKLTPELLVNDPGLVRVDLANRTNELKLSFPAGPKYIRIDDPNEKVWWAIWYKGADFPIKDSAQLLPIDLTAGRYRQVFITVRVPEGTPTGEYTGRLKLTSGGRQIGRMPFTVRVLPFELAPARTNYDLSKPFDGSIYYFGEIRDGDPIITIKDKTEQQFRAELKTMREHGINAPFFVFYKKVYMQEENERKFRRHLAILKEMGFANQPLYLGESCLGNSTDPKKLEELKKRVRRVVSIAREYDFTDVYLYGFDEAKGERLLSQRSAWKATHEAGGKITVSGYEGLFKAVGDLLDVFIRAANPSEEDPEPWHKNGFRLWSYGYPQSPAESPDLYRRNYGLVLWRADYDGFCPWIFMGGVWNDFPQSLRSPNMAYPTLDGVVGTLALEGLREAKDDVRYATTLRLAIKEAQDTGDAESKQLAAKASGWLNSLSPATCDLDEARSTMIRYIIALSK